MSVSTNINSEKITNFISKKRKKILVAVAAALAVAVVVCITLLVKDYLTKKAIAALDSVEYSYSTKKMAAKTAENADVLLADAQKAALSGVKEYLGKSGVAGVRANMLAGSVAYDQKDFENSLKYFIAAVKADEKAYTAPLAYFNAAECAEMCGKSDDAVAYFKKAAESKDFYLVSHAWFNAGRVSETNGKFDVAATFYKKVIDLGLNDDWTKLAHSRLIVLKAENKVN
ncbi:MAG: tetratricopeptide repeat protein [Treponema sp.]|nr:tetratricopeptide repeat protein [Treponema sp.]